MENHGRQKSEEVKPKETEAASAKGSITTRAEQKQVEERQAIGANVVYETIRREGEDELHRPAAALAWSALAAGLSMGFSFVAEAVLMAHLPDTPWRPLISRAGYCVGFLIVILGRQQLFTENTLTVILPLLARKDLVTLLRVLRLWGVVLSANLAGTFLFALCVARIGLFEDPVQRVLQDAALAHMGTGFGIVFARAIFAGWLIALMVWLLPGADSGRLSIIIIITYLVGIGSFNHIVAGSTTALFLVLTKSISWGTYFTLFFIPTLLGNIFGGVSLVAALGHAQVVGGKN
jgi:formate/nitrite transporter FocA (FNT family)